MERISFYSDFTGHYYLEIPFGSMSRYALHKLSIYSYSAYRDICVGEILLKDLCAERKHKPSFKVLKDFFVKNVLKR